MGFSILLSAEVFKHNASVWYLDGSIGVLIGLTIFAYGAKWVQLFLFFSFALLCFACRTATASLFFHLSDEGQSKLHSWTHHNSACSTYFSHYLPLTPVCIKATVLDCLGVHSVAKPNVLPLGTFSSISHITVGVRLFVQQESNILGKTNRHVKYFLLYFQWILACFEPEPAWCNG